MSKEEKESPERDEDEDEREWERIIKEEREKKLNSLHRAPLTHNPFADLLKEKKR